MVRRRTRGVSAGRAILTGALVIGFAVFSAPASRAVTDLCGATVVEDVNLDQDLVCAGGGITVGADGIRIHLQGHSITGPGAGAFAGIRVAGHSNVSIVGGTIQRFMTGVLVNTATNVEIKEMILRSNVDGVDLQAGSRDVTVKASEFIGNTTRGVMMRGDVIGVDVKDNSFTGNRVGVLLFAPTGATVKANTISGSLLAGVRINFPATGNLLLDNIVTSNPSGIEFLADATGGGASGNTIKANVVTANTCGLKGPGAGNTFLDNQVSGNVTDVCS